MVRIFISLRRRLLGMAAQRIPIVVIGTHVTVFVFILVGILPSVVFVWFPGKRRSERLTSYSRCHLDQRASPLLRLTALHNRRERNPPNLTALSIPLPPSSIPPHKAGNGSLTGPHINKRHTLPPPLLLLCLLPRGLSLPRSACPRSYTILLYLFTYTFLLSKFQLALFRPRELRLLVGRSVRLLDLF